jgi:SPP1 family predicted phage head-tail adaptor
VARSALSGQMNTKITVKALTQTQDSDGYSVEVWTDVFGEQVWCKWVNAHGTEVFEGLREDLKEVATITMRYSNRVDQRCLIYHEQDPKPYEIISINNVMDRRRFLEIVVKRKVKA